MSTPDTNQGLLLRLAKSMVNERAAYIGRERSKEAKQYRLSQDMLLQATKAIGKSGDVDLILSAEAGFLKNDARFYSNSPSMRSSLAAALTELGQAQKMLPLVKDPDLYLAIDASHGNAKSRIGGVPRDAARQFFQSHNARLLNADKSRLTDTEKQILDARRHNIRVAALAYTAQQEQALGVGLVAQVRERILSM